jgi:hypothetical protein
MRNWKLATASPLELASDPVRDTEALYVVAFTPDGRVPLLVDRRPAARTGATTTDSSGATGIIRLPGLVGWRPFDPLPSLHGRLREEAGVDADELVVMSRYGIPTGERGRATIVLAPHARTFPSESPFGASLRLVSLGDLAAWLAGCREKGIRVDARVWVGLILAERHFPRWAQARLRAEAEELHRRNRPFAVAAESRK